MNVNPIGRLPTYTIPLIINHLECKDLASLEQSCKEIKDMVCEKKIWEKFCEQYAQVQTGENIKTYLRDHTISNSEKLGKKIARFFCDTLHSKNVFFTCLFREKSCLLEIERIQNTQEKNSLTILYTGQLDKNTRFKINETVNDMLSIQEMLFQSSFKKNIHL